jgi:hypothetical protein
VREWVRQTAQVRVPPVETDEEPPRGAIGLALAP